MIEIGAKLTVEKTVTPELTAQMAGSGMLPVFGTPFMTAMMENAAAGVLQHPGAGVAGMRAFLRHVTVLAADDDAAAQALSPLIHDGWSLATALSLLVWYIYAPMCLSTLASPPVVFSGVAATAPGSSGTVLPAPCPVRRGRSTCHGARRAS